MFFSFYDGERERVVADASALCVCECEWNYKVIAENVREYYCIKMEGCVWLWVGNTQLMAK